MKNQRGEIATILTLVSVGMMLMGTIAGTKLAKTGTRFIPLAMAPITENCPNAGETCSKTEEGEYRSCCDKPKNNTGDCESEKQLGTGVALVYQCTSKQFMFDPKTYSWIRQNNDCRTECAPACRWC